MDGVVAATVTGCFSYASLGLDEVTNTDPHTCVYILSKIADITRNREKTPTETKVYYLILYYQCRDKYTFLHFLVIQYF